MAEELVLTDPVVVPEKVTDTYHIINLTFSLESAIVSPIPGLEQGLLSIQLKDNLGVFSNFSYHGQQAIDMIKWLNTADFTIVSMNRKILNRLSADGHLPGTVTGTPEPPPASDPFEV